MTIHQYLMKALQEEARQKGERDRLLLEARRARRGSMNKKLTMFDRLTAHRPPPAKPRAHLFPAADLTRGWQRVMLVRAWRPARPGPPPRPRTPGGAR